MNTAILRRCPACRLLSMRLVGPALDWGDDAPPIDAAEFELWRCATVVQIEQSDGSMKAQPCACEIKRKPDGSTTKDPRWEQIPWEIRREH